MSYHWEETGKSGGWEVYTYDGHRVGIDITDCGCCGSVDVLWDLKSVEEFDKRWEELRLKLRERVIEALEADE